ncbi:ATP-binding protein [Lactococcus garvieae subsp. garvieae]|uniref:ATP-binding protein n=1 Tax=Lactococcus garvieae TaxID=1363 RepID=UPI0005A8457A|nr:ATP-binding protein [Lactococcus garvieae]KAA8713666.1 ATP-binding protein [Lactococcus garvieae subsp. garvieae]MDG6190538.1 ATP-binding protein [Lactococcus garvieae]QPR48420.1 ATP-binding protein [Lactococcus garvieae]
MNIDSYYPEIDKNNFYLGMISQVYRSNVVLQVDNLSLFNNRKIKDEILIPNTINFFVVIDSAHGLFLGEIFQSKVSGTDSLHKSKSDDKKEKVFPEISIDIIGVLGKEEKFSLPGFKTVGITDKVYLANRELIQKYLNSIEVHTYFKDKAGRIAQEKLNNLAKIGNFESEYLSLQPNTLFDRHLMAIGTTNSGKSTSALAILDKLINAKKKILLIDPTGEYKDSFTDSEITKLTLGKDTTLSAGDILMSQWERIFETNENTQGATLGKAIRSLRYQKKTGSSGALLKDNQNINDIKSKLSTLTPQDTDFNLIDLPSQIQKEAVEVNKKGDKYTTASFYVNTNNWLFEKVQHVLDNSTLTDFFTENSDTNLLRKIDSFLLEETSIYIDASEIGTSDGIGAMLIDLISNYVINKKRNKIPPFIMFIDEVHRYLSIRNEYQSGMITCAREGRKKGIFLFLTTQNPKDVPDVLLGQVGTLIIHRVTHSEELKAIQNHVHYNTISQIQKLNQGEAILTSINLLQDIHVRFEKCGRVHENDTPIL